MTSKEAARIAAQVDGWMEDDCLQWLFNTAQELLAGSLVVELGSWLGRSTVSIALGLKKPRNIICVDTWEGSKNEPAECFKTAEPAQELFQRNLPVQTAVRDIFGDKAVGVTQDSWAVKMKEVDLG